ncbi:hypothetical protein C8F01DRAFT_191741 [Mycena amicta]|nr:hypothetical protein C8F01DRAFT_191741 [Mycena amicta]
MGPHLFLVQLQDLDTHRVLPGLTTGDIGLGTVSVRVRIRTVRYGYCIDRTYTVLPPYGYGCQFPRQTWRTVAAVPYAEPYRAGLEPTVPYTERTVPSPSPKVMDGFTAVDNGFTRFDHVRVTDSGEYATPPHAKLSYGGMMYIRSGCVVSLSS